MVDFPVVDKSNKLVGIVTARDVIGKETHELIEKVMTKTSYIDYDENKCCFCKSPNDLGRDRFVASGR